MICIYKEHNGRLIDQETIVVRTYPVRWNAPNRRAVVQPRIQISKLQTYRHTLSSEQIQACRPAGVKNYMLADALIFFVSSFSFPSLFFSYCFFFFFSKNHTRLPPRRHRTVQNCHTGVVQNYKLAATQA